MNEPYIYEGSVVHYARPNVCLENGTNGGPPAHENSTYIHAIVDDEWKYLGLVRKPVGFSWHYLISTHGCVDCETALAGINAVLRDAGVVTGDNNG